MPDFSLKNFEVTKELGRGGMATVYEAIQHPIERSVALKVLLPHLTLNETVELEPGDYELHASAPGYESSYISLRIPGDSPLIDLSLKKFLEIDEFYDYAATINGELSAKAFLSKHPASLMTRIIAIANSPNRDAQQSRQDRQNCQRWAPDFIRY